MMVVISSPKPTGWKDGGYFVWPETPETPGPKLPKPLARNSGPKLPVMMDGKSGLPQLSTGLLGFQKGSFAGTNSIGTSVTKDFSHAVQYFMPPCSETTCPNTINAF
jgi:hypothetical protein